MEVCPVPAWASAVLVFSCLWEAMAAALPSLPCPASQTGFFTFSFLLLEDFLVCFVRICYLVHFTLFYIMTSRVCREEGADGMRWPSGLHQFKTPPENCWSGKFGIAVGTAGSGVGAPRGSSRPRASMSVWDEGVSSHTVVKPPVFACIAPALAQQHSRSHFGWFNTHPTKISCVSICVAFFSGKKIEL